MLLTRTRFGFDLRATGQSESAAVASGVNVKRMVVYAMLLSGAVAGLIGMPSCSATRTRTARRSRPASASPASRSRCSVATTRSGSPSAPLIFAFLNEQSNTLGILADISPDIISVTQGVVVLSVVIAYEVVRRYRDHARTAGRGRERWTTRARQRRWRHERRSIGQTAAARHRPTPGYSAAMRLWMWVLLVLVVLSVTRVVTGADDITSTGHPAGSASIAAIPIALAGLGGLWSERAGVVNIGLEGMMILGTLGAGYYGYHYGPWVGVCSARWRSG